MKTVFGHNSLFFVKLVSGLIPLLAVLTFYFKLTSAGTLAQSPAPSPAAAIKSDLHSPRLRDVEFYSPSLRRKTTYRILLPRRYSVRDDRYPVLYLLHGLDGDYTDWTKETNVIANTDHLDLIIAMPDAKNSWYTNSPSDPTAQYENFLMRDFIAEIDGKYRTIPERKARFVAGLSMGGYAAMFLSIKYPNVFSYAGGFSASLDAPLDMDTRIPNHSASLPAAFGPHNSETRRDDDVFSLLDESTLKTLPVLYLDIGEQDQFFLEINRRFVAKLQKLKVPYDYHELRGDHTWGYWDAALLRFLRLTRAEAHILGSLPPD
jgi:S-formylglutathione hydrolase FrmB